MVYSFILFSSALQVVLGSVLHCSSCVSLFRRHMVHIETDLSEIIKNFLLTQLLFISCVSSSFLTFLEQSQILLHPRWQICLALILIKSRKLNHYSGSLSGCNLFIFHTLRRVRLLGEWMANPRIDKKDLQIVWNCACSSSIVHRCTIMILDGIEVLDFPSFHSNSRSPDYGCASKSAHLLSYVAKMPFRSN